jgi:hypothetical protein
VDSFPDPLLLIRSGSAENRLERGPLSLVSTTEGLLGSKAAALV